MACRRTLVILAVAAAAVVPCAAGDDVCGAVALHTLTFACGGLCEPLASCARQDANAPSPCADVGSDCVRAPSGACDMQCFAPLRANATAFTFYVTFDSSKRASNASEASNVTSPSNEQGADTADWDRSIDTAVTRGVPSESNEYVRRVGELALPTTIVDVTISGGRSTEGTRGRVADVEIDAAIFRSAPQVMSVALVNIDLKGTEATLSALMPSTMMALDLHNTKLSRVPSPLTSLSMLETLILDQNEITEVPAGVTFHNVKTLRLSDNTMAMFSASIPAVESLDLSNNRLTVFPYDALASTRRLRTLRVASNPTMARVVFSASHFAKISSLDEFTIDRSALDRTSCAASQVQTISKLDVSVCVLSDAEWAARFVQARGHSKIVLVVSLVAALVVVAVAVGVYCLWRRKTQATRDKRGSAYSHATHRATTDFERMDDGEFATEGIELSSSQVRPSSLDVAGSSPRYRLSHDAELLAHRVQSDLLEDVRAIGSGGCAVVWLVEYVPQRQLLASKRLAHDQVTRQRTVEFVVEIKLNMQLVHPSIIAFVGVAWTCETDLQALLEYMPNGDLRTHLDTADATRSPWGVEKLCIAIDIIEALVYVHSFSPPLVHRDLKSRNVLLADDMKAKLCDFGVSRFASVNNTMTTAVGTGKWLAPEVVAGSKGYDESCDIYAFGVILSELDTHRVPYDDVEDQSGQSLPEATVLRMVAAGQLQPTMSGTCPEEIRQVAVHCLAFDPADRPTAIGVAYALRRLRNDWTKHKNLIQSE